MLRKINRTIVVFLFY